MGNEQRTEFHRSYLKPGSVIIDIGGHTGEDTMRFIQYFGSEITILVYEPHPKYFTILTEKFKNYPQVKLFNYGLDGTARMATLSDDTDGSSVFKEGTISIELREVNQVISQYLKDSGRKEIDLLHINCEGCEFGLLEGIIDQRVTNLFKNIEMQFHYYDFKGMDNIARMCRIQEQLSITHKSSFLFKYVWENWERVDS